MPAADHIGVPVCRRGTQPGGGARPAEAVRLRLHQSPAAQPSPGTHARQASELPGDAGLGGLGTGRIADAHPQDRIALAGVIRETETVTAGGSPVYRCVLAGGSGDLDVLFLGRATVAGLTVGTRGRIQGTVTRRGGRLAVWNPRYQLEPRMHGARGGAASEPARPESAEPPSLAEPAWTAAAATSHASSVGADGP